MEGLRQCLNCDHALEADYHYCPNCGQEARNSAASLGAFFQHFLSDYFTFDSKIARSFIPLITRPGFLTEEFFAGKRVRYITPLRLYIFISIVFFLVLSLVGHEHEGLSEDDLFWNTFFGNYLPKVFFILLPLFALVLFGLYARKRINYVKHFVFSLHFHAFVFILTLLYLLVSEAFSSMSLVWVNQILSIVVALGTLVYLFLAMKRVYAQSVGKTLVKFLLLGILYGGLLVVVVTFSLLILQSRGS